MVWFWMVLALFYRSAFGILQLVLVDNFHARFNEAKLKEIADEKESSAFRQRASRLSKWRELAEQAAAEHKAKIRLPETVEIFVMHLFVHFQSFSIIFKF